MMTTRVFSIDRIEKLRDGVPVAILMGEDMTSVEIPLSALPSRAGEGWIIHVPLVAGAPDWAAAVRNIDEEKRLRADFAQRLDRLRRVDSGGDISL